MRTGCLIIALSIGAWCDIAVAQHSVAYFDPNDARWTAGLVKSEAPAYPLVAKERHWQGKGVFRVKIDSRTRKVLQIRVIKSTGYKVLDDSSMIALKSWIWKPNQLKEVDVPVAYVLDRSARWPNLPNGALQLPPSPY